MPESILALEDAVRGIAISKDGDQVSVGALLAKSIWFVDCALRDGFEALTKDIDLNLVAAISIINYNNLSSIGKGNRFCCACC